MPAKTRRRTIDTPEPLPALRFEIFEAARMLRMSRAQLYHRIRERSIKPQKDGGRTYFTPAELERYVASCGGGALGELDSGCRTRGSAATRAMSAPDAQRRTSRRQRRPEVSAE
jgi:Helix-turn-helix domain